MAEKKRDPDEWKRWLWKCNRCYEIRTPLVGYCPECGSPEFTLIARTEAEDPPPTATRAGDQLNLF